MTTIENHLANLSFNHWPKPSDLQDFYGKIEFDPEGMASERWIARSTQRINLPFQMVMLTDRMQTIRRVRCHRRVMASLNRIIHAISVLYPSQDERSESGVNLFSGCFIPGSMSGRALSAHAYGAAIRIGDGKDIPGINEIFQAEGWMSSKGSHFAIEKL